MAAVLAVIAVATSAGVLVERRDPERTRRAIARALDLLLWVVQPVITFLVLSRFEPTAGAGAGILYAYLAAGVCAAAGFLLATRVLHLAPPAAGAVTVTVMFANTGYLGIPLCAALLGREAIAPAVVFDTLVSAIVLYVGAFAVGAALGTRAGDSRRARLRAYFTRNPVLVAMVLALLVPRDLVPAPAVDAAELAAIGLLPVGFFILGAHLAEVPLRASAGPLAVAAGVKLLLAPLVVLACSLALVRTPDAYLLEAAMPSGINSLIVAHAFGLDLRLTAAIVAWTHALVIAGAAVAGAVT